MSRLWLPWGVGQDYQQSKSGTVILGAESKQHEQELKAWADELAEKRQKEEQPKPEPTMSRKDIAAVLKEYLEFTKREKPKYY